jgi:thymidylate kinase
MKKIIISGPDGTGKSTISKMLINFYKKKGLKVKYVWLRFNHYFSKIINFVGRISGKSYYENYEWGKVGYHDYKGIFGKFYIYSVYLDHKIFLKFFSKKYFNNKSDVVIIDRYIIDIMVDLIVDTDEKELVIKLFKKYLEDEIRNNDIYILECNPEIVFQRRPDVKYDKKYLKKVKAYNILKNEFGLKSLNTGEMNENEIVQKIIKEK